MISIVNSAPSNLGGRILGMGAVLGVARIIMRSFDLVRMLTIARWLGPEEMGIFAVATLILTALEQFAETGLKTALIQKQEDITLYIIPVRTLQALRGITLGLIVYITAPVVASFFGSPGSLAVLRVVALVPVLRGFEPLFITLEQKELRFRSVAAVQIVSSLVGVTVGVTAAYIRPDAWALVWSSIASAASMAVGSSLLSKRGHLGFTFRWRSLKDLRNFGFWIFVVSVVSYFFIKGGDWVIGRLLDVSSLALYQMAFLICTVATQEAGAVVSQMAFPVFSQLQKDMDRLRVALSQSFGIVSLLTLCMGGMIVSCSSDFFHLVLGNKWLPALPLIPWLTVWGVCSMFAGFIGGLFHALGKPKLWAHTVFCMTGLLALGVYPATRWFGALGVAVLMAGIGIAMQIVRYAIIGVLVNVSLFKILRHVLIPALASMSAALVTSKLRGVYGFDSHLVGLICSAAFFMSSYVFIVALGHRWLEPSPRELWQRARGLFRRSPAETLSYIEGKT